MPDDEAGGCALLRLTGRSDSVSFTWYKLEAVKTTTLCSGAMCEDPLARRKDHQVQPAASHVPSSTLRLGRLGAFLAHLGTTSVTIPCGKWDCIFSKQPKAQARSAAFWKQWLKTWSVHRVKRAFRIRGVRSSLVMKSSFLVGIKPSKDPVRVPARMHR